MTENVVKFSAAPGLPEILKMIDELRHRAFSGQLVALALVEHWECGGVNVEVSHSPASFHQLNSGAALLTHTLVTSAAAAAAMESTA